MSLENEAKALFKEKSKIETINKFSVVSMRARDANKIYSLVGGLESIDGIDNEGGKEANSEFCGSKFNEWMSEIETPKTTLKKLKDARNELSKQGIEHSLREILRDCTPVRKRRNSEHDGEWSMDRKWELKPFMRTDKVMGESPSLVIRCMIGFNSFTDAKMITEYASKAGALSDIIESLGIKTKLSIVHDNSNRFNNNEGKISHTNRFDFLIKDFDEYGSLDAIATCFHASTQRRTLFTLYAVCAASMNMGLTYGLGQSKQEPIIKDKAGEITVDINNLDKLIRGDTSEIKKLMNAIKQQSWNS